MKQEAYHKNQRYNQ